MARRGGTAVIVGMSAFDATSPSPRWSFFYDEQAAPRVHLRRPQVRRDFPAGRAGGDRSSRHRSDGVDGGSHLDEVNDAFRAMEAGEVIRSVIVYEAPRQSSYRLHGRRASPSIAAALATRGSIPMVDLDDAPAPCFARPAPTTGRRRRGDRRPHRRGHARPRRHRGAALLRLRDRRRARRRDRGRPARRPGGTSRRSTPLSAPAAAVAEEVAGDWLKELLGIPAAGVVRLRHRGAGGEHRGPGGRPPSRAGRRRLGRGARRPHRRAAGAGRSRVPSGTPPSTGRCGCSGFGTPRVEEVAADGNGAIDVGRARDVLAPAPPGRRSCACRPGNVNTGACDDLAAATGARRTSTARGCTSTARSGSGRRPARRPAISSPASSRPTRGAATGTSG